MIDYNKKYKFISDGTWFKKGTECVVEDGNCLWRHDKSANRNEITYEEMLSNKKNISGIFQGIRVCENPKSEGITKKIGQEYEDGETCCLDEFKILKKDLDYTKTAFENIGVIVTEHEDSEGKLLIITDKLTIISTIFVFSKEDESFIRWYSEE